MGAAPSALPAGTVWRIAAAPDPAAAALGFALGAYRFARYKAPPRPPARLVPPWLRTGGDGGRSDLARARDLINTPAADLGPVELAAAVRALAETHGASYEEIAGEALAAGFPAVAAVGSGSPRAPRVAVLRWEGDRAGPLIALCGKGCVSTPAGSISSPPPPCCG